jgi:hypothetical protein
MIGCIVGVLLAWAYVEMVIEWCHQLVDAYRE